MNSQYSRLVINKNVREDKKNRRLTEFNQIKYPPQKILDKIYYNRGNLPKVSAFYAAFGHLASTLETMPYEGMLYTQSEWQQRKGTYISYIPMCYREDIANSCDMFETEWTNYTDFLNSIDKNVAEVIKALYSFMTIVFTKPVNPNNKIEYIFSALFTNHFFYEDDNAVDCIVYPSVPSNFASQNIVLKPEVLEEKFELIELVEDFCFYHGNGKQWLSARTAKAVNLDSSDSDIIWQDEVVHDQRVIEMMKATLE